MDWPVADAATDDLIRDLQTASDREKVRRLNEWICAHMVYDPNATVGVVWERFSCPRNTVLIDKTHNTPYNMVSKTIMVIMVILWR